jgi:hypothetical protein
MFSMLNTVRPVISGLNRPVRILLAGHGAVSGQPSLPWAGSIGHRANAHRLRATLDIF